MFPLLKKKKRLLRILLILVLLLITQATVTADTIVESASVYFESIYQKALRIFETLAGQDIKNNLTKAFNWMLGMMWFLIPLAILVWMLKLIARPAFSTSKGEVGELIVNLEAERLLDKDKYYLLKNVTLRTGDGTTQIDHIIISIYGVFVVETKNMSGWIFGNPKQRTWTQIIYGDRYKFQNPLHQNYKHVKTLKSLLRLASLQLHSVVVFVGEGEFKTEMPENVTYIEDFIEYIESKQQPVLVENEVKEIIEKIETERLEPSLETHREHVNNLKSRIYRTN
ncbi:MAG: NERD domain-containing protein [Nitrospinota bacterium]|nr:NERD domain-containing protein [Nitrospinota bacterium]